MARTLALMAAYPETPAPGLSLRLPDDAVKDEGHGAVEIAHRHGFKLPVLFLGLGQDAGGFLLRLGRGDQLLGFLFGLRPGLLHDFLGFLLGLLRDLPGLAYSRIVDLLGLLLNVQYLLYARLIHGCL